MSNLKSKELNTIPDKLIKEEKLSLNIKLNDIKSKFIIKRIFSLLKEKKKLDLIKYNKNIQTILGINIEHYKK